MKNSFRLFIAALTWLVLCTVLLTLPASAFPSGRWYTKIPMFDKWVHIGLFSMLAFLFCLWLSRQDQLAEKKKKYFFYTGLLSLAYGIIMEFVQESFIPNRSFDYGDIVADGIGAAGGVIFCYLRYIKK